MNSSNVRAIFEIPKMLRIEKSYSILRVGVQIDVEIYAEDTVKLHLLDVVLDQLDTAIWPPHSFWQPKEVSGPRYVYVLDGEIMERTLGIDPYTICIDCDAVIVFDNSFPYPYAIGIVVSAKHLNARMAFRDAFDRGDADGDGVPEFHDVTLSIEMTLYKGSKIHYKVYIIPLSHKWSLKLPSASTETLAKYLLHPTLQDLLNETGYLRSFIQTSIPATVTIPRETTMTITTTSNIYRYIITLIKEGTSTITMTKLITVKLIEKSTTTVCKLIEVTKTVTRPATKTVTTTYTISTIGTEAMQTTSIHREIIYTTITSCKTIIKTTTMTTITVDPILINIAIGIVIGVSIVALLSILKSKTR